MSKIFDTRIGQIRKQFFSSYLGSYWLVFEKHNKSRRYEDNSSHNSHPLTHTSSQRREHRRNRSVDECQLININTNRHTWYVQLFLPLLQPNVFHGIQRWGFYPSSLLISKKKKKNDRAWRIQGSPFQALIKLQLDSLPLIQHDFKSKKVAFHLAPTKSKRANYGLFPNLFILIVVVTLELSVWNLIYF